MFTILLLHDEAYNSLLFKTKIILQILCLARLIRSNFLYPGVRSFLLLQFIGMPNNSLTPGEKVFEFGFFQERICLSFIVFGSTKSKGKQFRQRPLIKHRE